MPVVSETINLLLTPPGGLVYHLLILFSLEAILGMAVGAWRRRDEGPEETSGILALAAIGMLLARLILIAVALTGLSETRSAAHVIPPLERALDTGVTVLLAWALLPWGRSRDLSWLFLGLGLAGMAIVFALFLPTWQGDLATDPLLAYNGSWQETIWILAQLALLGLAILGLFWQRGREWGVMFAVLLLLTAGHALQLLVPDRSVHIAGWERLAQLMAFPLLAVAVYRRVIGSLSWRALQLEEVSQDSLSRIAGLIYLIESGQRTVASLDIAEVLDRAVKEVVRILKVDICGLIFPIDEERGRVCLAAVHDVGSRGAVSVVKFSLAEHPALAHAIKRKKQVAIDATVSHTQVQGLYVLMGRIDVGPLLVQPLLYDGRVIGALLPGNPTSQRQFTSSQQKLCQALSRQIAVAIENARRYGASQTERETLKAQYQESQKEHQRMRAAMKAQLVQSKEDAAHFARRLDLATADAERERQNAKSLAAQIQQAEEERAQFEAQVERARQEMLSLQQRLTDESVARAMLETQLAQASDQISQMAQKLRQRRSRISVGDVVLNALPIGFLITDENGRVEAVNAIAEELLAQPIERMLGKPIGEICDDVRWRDGIHQLLGAQTATSGKEPEVSLTIGTNNYPMSVKLRILRNENGEFAAVVAALGGLPSSEEARQARDRFLGALTQELRTPMTSITGYTDLLLGESVGVIGEMQRKFLQRIKANIERMGAMLSDLIGVTAIDSGQLYLEQESIDIGDAIQEAIAGARAQMEEKDLSVNVDLDPDVGSVEVDPNAFQQILSNLINNACKASPASSEIGIKASYQVEDHATGAASLVVSVIDSGGGIALEDQPRVFDRFYRAEQALIAGLGETGVGLSIVKALVEAHNGQVWVESRMNQGSSFFFALPATAVRQAASAENESLSAPRG
jgi:signal transduction histidine kinase/GAF domain-containing protein